MRTWISAPDLALALLVVSLGSARADQACTRLAKADEQTANGIATYATAGIRWKVTVDQQSSRVTIEDTTSRRACSTELDDLSAVYLSESATLLLRSTQIASDDVHFIDAGSCRPTRRSLSVADASDAEVAQRLEAAGFCLTTRP